MSNQTKRVEELTDADLAEFAVWQYVNMDVKDGETAVRPIKKTPVKNLTGCLVGHRARLANGEKVWALLGNIDATNPHLTQHFLTLSVLHDGRWFTMARYHDIDSHKRGPQAVASFLKLPVDDVFPISYDISRFCEGEAAALAGKIHKVPREKLTRAQIIGFAVPKSL